MNDKNHDLDFDRDKDRSDALDTQELKQTLEDTLETENELMRRYVMTAERIHDNSELKHRLQNLSEGNAKRAQQLSDELDSLQ